MKNLKKQERNDFIIYNHIENIFTIFYIICLFLELFDWLGALLIENEAPQKIIKNKKEKL